MTLRKHIKRWLYENCPGFAGAFPYYGTKVFFPKGSYVFRMACEQGIWERQIVNVLCSLVRPETVCFDIGANIGLMAIPVLHDCDSCTVVSLEPSPTTLKYLARTAAASGFRDRWRIVGKGAASKSGTLEFFAAAPAQGAYDGLHDTGRGGPTTRISVAVTTIDDEWAAMGQPEVSVLKIDVEGAEAEVLQGARQCIEQSHPYVIVEWNATNLRAYDCLPDRLLELASGLDYGVFSLPHVVRVRDSTMLRLQMLTGENFLLAPKQSQE